MFYFSIGALVLGIAGSIYLFLEWLRHGRQHRFLLFWSTGLSLLYIFQIPAILSYAGRQLVLTDFNRFFSLSFPLTFAGFLLIYIGVRSVADPSTHKKTYALLFAWLTAAAIFYLFYFRDDVIFTSRIPLYASIVLFFLPLHLLILSAVWKWYRTPSCIKTRVAKSGLALVAASELFGVFRGIYILRGVALYPPSFWFVVLTSPALFAAQIAGMLLLLVGFFFVHRDCFRDLSTAASGRDQKENMV